MVGHRWVRSLRPGWSRSARSAALVASTLAAPDRPWAPRACAGDGGRARGAGADRGPARPRRDRGRAVVPRGPAARRGRRPDGQRLTVGRRGRGAPATVSLPPESFAAGPFGDLILVGEDDGVASRLSTFDAGAGCRAPVDATADVIRRATVSPDGSTLYEARVARHDRADLGIWSRPLDGSVPARRVLPPPAADGRFGRTWSTELAWSAEGDRLAVQSCGEMACRTRLFDPSDGSSRPGRRPGPRRPGRRGRRPGRSPTAPAAGSPARSSRWTSATGARQVLAEASGPAVVVSVPGAAASSTRPAARMAAGCARSRSDGSGATRPRGRSPTARARAVGRGAAASACRPAGSCSPRTAACRSPPWTPA